MKGFDNLPFEQKVLDKFEKMLGKENVFPDEPMSKHTTFKVGGPADLFLTPTSEEMLVNLMNLLSELNLKYIVIGNGSNLLVKDRGIRGVVVKIAGNLSDIEYEDEIITSQSGISLSRLAKVALSHELTGLEFASGIPGTLGGAVFMNAGAYGGTMSDVVLEVKYYDCTLGKINSLITEDIKFGYRRSIFQEKCESIIIEVKMKLQHGNKDEIKATMDDLSKRRREKQPLEYPSCGSTFKRPENGYASKLIEEAGLKGLSYGGAMVSPKHSGFIINTGNAKASDILELIEMVKEMVYQNSGIQLNEEVRILGE